MPASVWLLAQNLKSTQCPVLTVSVAIVVISFFLPSLLSCQPTLQSSSPTTALISSSSSQFFPTLKFEVCLYIAYGCICIYCVYVVVAP